MRFEFLSYPMSADAPRPPAIPAPELSAFMTIERDGASVQRLNAYNHTGTHLDTAAHVLLGGISIEDFVPDDLVFHRIALCSFDLPDRCHILPEHLAPFEKDLRACDMALCRFGVEAIRKNQPERFSSLLPGFTPEAAVWLREHCPGLRCLGMDLPSMAVISDLENTMSAHHAFLEGNARKMLIIEEMKLDAVPPAGCRRIIVSPWLFAGMNSGPCTVWAEIP